VVGSGFFGVGYPLALKGGEFMLGEYPGAAVVVFV
jgi:hypothetical protein